MEFRYLCCIKFYQMLFAGQKSDSLLESDFSISAFQYSFHLIVRVILKGQVNKNISRCGIRQWKLSPDKRIFDCNCSIVCEENIIPDTDITTTDSGNPVPANGGMESGIIRSQNSSILVCTVSCLFLDGTRMSIFDNLYRYDILPFSISFDTSNLPRINAPSIFPIFFPFKNIFAFQLMPSKFKKT